ncbi:glutathione peroxidase [Aestuariibius sp. 2305UL40-4]|uniref:glutathione peroxidase n=1 Tax=Aestuariibius violaceus TaxID=3234132 RepID=UPI00345E18AA
MIRTLLLCCLPTFAAALPEEDTFPSIDGGTLELSDWAGQPILIVNTASLCGFVDQYAGLQELWERYRDDGLVVLAVPSDDFRQELGSDEEVAEFCELTYGLDLPMTTITSVRGADAHPVYDWLLDEAGFVPRWNFNKALIGRDGEVAATWGSNPGPLSRAVVSKIEAALGN